MTLPTRFAAPLAAGCVLLLWSCDGGGGPTATTQPPLAAIASGAYEAYAGEVIQFDGSGSTDPAGLELSFSWDFGNGGTGTGPTPTYTYNKPGVYDVRLVVTNVKGKSAEARTTARIAEFVLDTLVKDHFDRTLPTSWGIAPTGGEWLLTRSGQDAFSVANGVGRITKSDTTMRNAVLSGGYGLNVSGLASFSIDRMPDANAFYTVQVYARRDDAPAKGEGNHHYRFRVRAHSDGKMDVAVDKTVAGVTQQIEPANLGIPTAWEPGAWYWIRWEVEGTAPSTALRARVWRDGASEPGDWQLDLTHNEPGLDFPGNTGFRFSGPNTGQTTWPVTFSTGDLILVKL